MFALLLACATDPEPTGADTAASIAPTPYIYDEAEPPAPLLDATALEVALDNTLGRVQGLGAAPAVAAYQSAAASMESGCPDFYESDGNVYWYDQCTTAAGARFEGYGFYYAYDATDVGDGLLYDGAAFSGVARITDVAGHTFEAGGSVYALRGTADTHTAWQSVVSGGFAWDGPEADGTWLTGEITPDLSWYAVIAATNDAARAVYVDGGISGFDGEISAVVFDEVLLVNEGWGGVCPSEPGGVVSVRDTAGGWYDIVLDGPAEWGATADASRCEGCGEAYFRGESMGTVCADFTALLGWEGTPW